jgi:hypothetical protein
VALGLRFYSDATKRAHLSATEACHRKLTATGADLTAYNSTESAADVADLRKVLGSCPHLPVSRLTLQPVSEVDAAAGRGELDATTDGEEVSALRGAPDTATGLNASTRL